MRCKVADSTHRVERFSNGRRKRPRGQDLIDFGRQVARIHPCSVPKNVLEAAPTYCCRSLRAEIKHRASLAVVLSNLRRNRRRTRGPAANRRVDGPPNRARADSDGSRCDEVICRNVHAATIALWAVREPDRKNLRSLLLGPYTDLRRVSVVGDTAVRAQHCGYVP